MTTTLLMVGCAVGGLFTGVWVNMLIMRAPGSAPFVAPLTRCGSAPHRGAGRSLVPVIGPRLAGGTCPGCGQPLEWWQPVVDVANAVLWGLAAWRFSTSLTLIAMLPFFTALLALSVIDLKTYRLPDRINLPLLLGSIPLIVVISFAQGDLESLKGAAIGGLGFWGVLALMWFIHPRGMGYGDVKLARVLGLYLGWVHVMLPIYGLMFAGIGGSVAGIAMLAITRDRMKGFPFGPWLAAGAVLAIMLSETLTRNF